MQPPSDGLDLSDAEKLARLRLIRSENIGPITFHRLLEQFGTARKALQALPDMAKNGGRKKALKICTPSAAEDELAALVPLNISTVFWGEAGYPPLLAHIDDAPPLLFVRGHPHLLTKKSVAVVGSRNASVNGRRLVHGMARTLGEAGYLVVSGMARGIDAAAHDGALTSGTLGVLGGGVDVIYPRENDVLYGHIRDTGALVSEVTCNTPPQSRHFPRRNRIISGIARAVVVIEAGAKSGSLITARMALEQGRDVYAVPGPPQGGRWSYARRRPPPRSAAARADADKRQRTRPHPRPRPQCPRLWSDRYRRRNPRRRRQCGRCRCCASRTRPRRSP